MIDLNPNFMLVNCMLSHIAETTYIGINRIKKTWLIQKILNAFPYGLSVYLIKVHKLAEI